MSTSLVASPDVSTYRSPTSFGFFIEDLIGNDVLGRIIPNVGLVRGTGAGGTTPEGSFLKAIRLVE